MKLGESPQQVQRVRLPFLGSLGATAVDPVGDLYTVTSIGGRAREDRHPIVWCPDPTNRSSTIGVVQRDVEGGRIVWLFNESPLPQLVAAKLASRVTSVQVFDPETGRERDAVLARAAADVTITLTLAGARGAALFLRP